MRSFYWYKIEYFLYYWKYLITLKLFRKATYYVHFISCKFLLTLIRIFNRHEKFNHKLNLICILCSGKRYLFIFLKMNFIFLFLQQKISFLIFPEGFSNPIIFSNLNLNCSDVVLDLKNLKEKVKKAFCFKNGLTFHCLNKLF